MTTIRNLSFSPFEVREISLSRIEPDPTQLRKEFSEDRLDALKESIVKNGLQQPIRITQDENGLLYRIVDGERRWRAHMSLGLETIKAIYTENPTTENILLANLLSESYNPMEISDAYTSLKELWGTSYTDEQLGERVGKSRSVVSEYISLQRLPMSIKDDARKKSVVPFRKLKSLASAKLSFDKKEQLYQEYKNEYLNGDNSSSKTKKTPQENAKKFFEKDLRSFQSRLTKIDVASLNTKDKQEYMQDVLSTIEILQNVLKSNMSK